MNLSRHSGPGDDALLLSLVFPSPLYDPLVDWLLDQDAVGGFVSQPVNGHGGSEHGMSPSERVAGYRKGWLVQTHLPREDALALLERLKREFAGSDLHYWLTPLVAGGHLG